MRKVPRSVALALLLASAGQAGAQDLQFPFDVSDMSSPSATQMALYRPEGAGPFPAIVLVHPCSGLSRSNMRDWAEAIVRRGYVAFVIDSLGPRGVSSVCDGPRNGVHFGRGTRDALQAIAHLRTLSYVDAKRVALVGFSWGAMVGVFASSRNFSEMMLPGARPNAVVAFYPGCHTIVPSSGTPYEVVRPDIDRPLLVLLGERDNETPARECQSRMEPLQAAGAPIEIHLYAGATHCWDCWQLNGQRKPGRQGASVLYLYDRAITEDSAKRMFEFLERHLQR